MFTFVISDSSSITNTLTFVNTKTSQFCHQEKIGGATTMQASQQRNCVCSVAVLCFSPKQKNSACRWVGKMHWTLIAIVGVSRSWRAGNADFCVDYDRDAIQALE